MGLDIQMPIINKGRVTQMSVTNQDGTVETVQLGDAKVTVQSVNEAVQEAGDMPKLTAKQQDKLKAKLEREWGKMISRKEAHEMIQKAVGDTEQRLQLLMIQNRTLLELLSLKGIATEEEINEHSKKVIESIFGTPPVDEKEKEEGEQPNE